MSLDINSRLQLCNFYACRLKFNNVTLSKRTIACYCIGMLRVKITEMKALDLLSL